MQENKPASHYKNDDLDLIVLLERLIKFLRAYGALIVIWSVIGLVMGFVLYKTMQKQYTSTLLLHSYTLTNTEQINIIENWNDLLKSHEYKVLGERLNCSPGMLEKVSSLKASEIQKLYIQNNPNGFMVEAVVKDNAMLDSLGNGIVYGLENVDYIKARLASKRSNLTQLIEKVKSEIIKLDSTKKNIEYSINNNQHGSSFIVDVSTINGQMIGFNEKLLGYQDELKFTNAVQVLHKFEKFNRPASPKLFKLLLLGFIGGFAFGYLLAICFYLRRKVAKRRN